MKSNRKSKKNKAKREATTAEVLRQSRMKILNENSPYAFKEAYVRLRTNLMFGVAASGESGCKVVVVTSSNPSEGKTTNSINIAISFAMLGKRVLLIDSDMRKPQVARVLNVEQNNGFSNLLGGVGECVIHTITDVSLDFISAGKIPPNPAELLSSPAFKARLNELKQQYDYIFIDTPPVNSVADAQIIAPNVDGVALIVRAETTRIQDLLRAEEVLRSSGARIIGIIANNLETKASRYSYSYKAYKEYKEYREYRRHSVEEYKL